MLTVLGYSLYDTVVVFDRIRDNSKGLGASGRITYSEMVNLSMNQTLARSINTSLVAIIPVLSVLVVGSFLLGATSLQDFGLALVIGLTSGAYSSIFIASPLLAWMKEREPRYVTIRQRLETRGESGHGADPGHGRGHGRRRRGGRATTPGPGHRPPGSSGPAPPLPPVARGGGRRPASASDGTSGASAPPSGANGSAGGGGGPASRSDPTGGEPTPSQTPKGEGREGRQAESAADVAGPTEASGPGSGTDRVAPTGTV